MTDTVLTYKLLADMQEVIQKIDTMDAPKPLHDNYDFSWQRPQPLNLCGMKIINSSFIKPEHVGDNINVIPISKNRSRRVFKKLCKRRRARARPILVDVAYVFNGNIVASPKIVNQMNSIYKIEI